MSEADAAILGSIQRSTSGAATLWDDANTTTIAIGGGAAQGTVTIGKAGVGNKINGWLNIGTSSQAVAADDFSAGNLFWDNSANTLALGAGIIAITGANTDGDYLDITGTANGTLDIHVNNSSTGALASSRLLIETADAQAQFTAHSAAHATWPDTIILSASSNASGGLALSTGQGPMTFYTEATKRWEFQGAGHFLASGGDNTYDIGASGTTRPRTGYFGTSMVVGNAITITSTNVDSSAALNIGGTTATSLAIGRLGVTTDFPSGSTVDFTGATVTGFVGSGAGGFGFLNVGTSTTTAVANGDLAAGDGTRELSWDASAGSLTLTSAYQVIGTPTSPSTAVGAFSTGVGGNYAKFDGVTGITCRSTASRSGQFISDSPVANNNRQIVAVVDGESSDTIGLGGGVQFNATHANATGYEQSGIRGYSEIVGGGIGQKPSSLAFLSQGNTHPSASDLSIKWRILGAGHLIAHTDNLYDVGASGATRPRTGYFGTSLNVGGGITPSTANGDAVFGDGTRSVTYDASASILNFTGADSTISTGAATALSVLTGTTGALTVDSGTTGAVNLGTGASAKTVTIGNVTGATGLVINAGTAGVSIAGAASTAVMPVNVGTGGTGAKTVTVGSIASTSSLLLQSGTGAIDLGTNAIAKTITIGNVTGATAVVLNTGTGGVDLKSTGGVVQVNTLPLPSVLSSTAIADAKTPGTTNLYTVPTGRTAIIMGAMVRVSEATAITVGLVAGIGVAAGEDDIVVSQAHTALLTTAKVYHLANAGGVLVAASAASVIKYGIDTGATGTSQALVVDLLGYLV